jgi:hypothetical protein
MGDAVQGAKQDELLESHFQGQLRQEPCLYLVTLAYGSNTAWENAASAFC